MKTGLKVSRAEFEEWMRPRLMLFLSADIENSTRLKQHSGEREWVREIMEFIHEFPDLFQAEREKTTLHAETAPPAPEPPWKVLGDEVIFALEIRNEAQPGRELTAYRLALNQWNARQMEKQRKPALTVKGTIWFAGFPVANALVPVSGGTGKPVIDYIGPSMDAGFRLSKTATSKRLILSVEVAWWILQYGPPEGGQPEALHFQGCSEHKGLAEETGYPQIWTELHLSKYQRLEDSLLGRTALLDSNRLKDMCAAFIHEFGVPCHLPFLRGGSGEKTLQHCPDFAERLVAVRDEMRSILFVDDDGAELSGAAARQAEGEALQLLNRIPQE